MRRKHRTPRGLNELLKALDDHQFLLRQNLHGLKDDPANIEQVASELRVLVCDSSETEGLLWRIADALHVSDVMPLSARERVNRDHPLTRSLGIFVFSLFTPGEGPPNAPAAGFLSLRDVIKNCEAIFVAQISDRVLTHELLIKAVAEQIGGAHEDD